MADVSGHRTLLTNAHRLQVANSELCATARASMFPATRPHRPPNMHGVRKSRAAHYAMV
jgi:hypothetical protein